jgi:hypothetical protein
VSIELKEGTHADYIEYKKVNMNDGYSQAIVDFSELWATLMEVRIAGGEALADIAEATCSEADKQFGITGFMYDCAIQSLGHYWKYGEELKRWHNRKYEKDPEKADRLADEGKTISTSVFTFDTTEDGTH